MKIIICILIFLSVTSSNIFGQSELEALTNACKKKALIIANIDCNKFNEKGFETVFKISKIEIELVKVSQDKTDVNKYYVEGNYKVYLNAYNASNRVQNTEFIDSFDFSATADRMLGDFMITEFDETLLE